MNIVIKSCRSLLLLLFFANCNNNGEPAALSFFYDSTSSKPVAFIKLSPKEYEAHKNNWGDFLWMYKVENGKPTPYKIIAEYIYRNDTLFMTPHFKPDAGLEFEAQVIIKSDTVRKRIQTPVIAIEAAVSLVQHVYPTSSEIPENILMFHIVFDQPMNEDPVAFKKIKLIDENGKEKQMVWRERSNWTSDGKHLIMMIHPGWVKRDIHYLDKFGPEFKPGKKYTLVVGADLKDRYGRNISQEYKKEFVIVEADRKVPVFNKTKPISIKAGTSDSLFINFSEAIDYGSALIGIYIKDANGSVVEGNKIPITDNRWAFIPKNVWKKTQYTLELTQELSDISCNNLHRHFEEQDIEKMKPAAPIVLAFTPN